MAKRTLNKRDKQVLTIGGIFLVTMAFLQFGKGYLEEYQWSKDALSEAQERLKNAREMRVIIEEERGVQDAIVAKINARPNDFDLYSFVNGSLKYLEMSDRAKLTSKRVHRGSGNHQTVDLILSGVRMEQIVNLLHGMFDSDNLIALKSLKYLRPTPEKKGMECALSLTTPFLRKPIVEIEGK